MKKFQLKHGATSIPVFFVDNDTITKAGKGLLEEGQFLFGMFSAKRPKIFINAECDDQFGTLIHEISEFIVNRYGVKLTHEQLSVMSAITAKVLEENWNKIGSVFNLSDKMPRKDNGQGTRLTVRALKKPKVKRSR